MAHSSLAKESRELESQILETLMAGWKSRGEFPQSTSDLICGVRALMMMFDIKRRPLPKSLPLDVSETDGKESKGVLYYSGPKPF